MMRKTLISLLLLTAIILNSGCGLPLAANLDDGTLNGSFSDDVAAAETEATDSDPGEQNPDENTAFQTYEEFLEAKDSTYLTIVSFLQRKDSWKEGKTNLFLQDESGAYYVYGLSCSSEEYHALSSGQKLLVRGYKSSFSGELMITDAEIERLDGFFIASPADVSELLGTDELYNYLNHSVCVPDLIIKPMFDGSSPFFRGWDNSHAADPESDLYFTGTSGDSIMTFVVKRQLCDSEADGYETVQSFRIGDTVAVEGILFWYNEPQILVTSVRKMP